MSKENGGPALAYYRTSQSVFFLFPAVAVGVDVDGRYFIEFAWLCWAIGLGSKP